MKHLRKDGRRRSAHVKGQREREREREKEKMDIRLVAN